MEGTELRCNPATGLWSCHQTKAAATGKPVGYVRPTSSDSVKLTHERAMRDPKKNPFDLANTSKCPVVLASAPDPAHPSLEMVRAFDNKFPALMRPKEEVEDHVEEVPFVPLPGVGLQEVVVQHWRMNTCEALMTQEANRIATLCVATLYCTVYCVLHTVCICTTHTPSLSQS
jgi:hypothetical protein